MSALSPLAALLGGALTLLAPCSVLVLPAFFSYAFQSARALLGRTALFWLGLLLVLVPLGTLAGAAGTLLREHLDLLARLAACFVIAFGVLEALALDLPRTRRRARAGGSEDLTSPAAILLLGASYGVAGVGCAGPILGAVLVAAGFQASPVRGALLMVLYATGMALPLLLLAALWRVLRLSERSWLRPRPLTVLGRPSTWTNLASGLLLIALGLVLLFGGASNPLGGLIASERLAAWEEAIMRLGSLVPAWALVLALAAVIAALCFLRRPSSPPSPPAPRALPQRAESITSTRREHYPHSRSMIVAPHRKVASWEQEE